MKLVIELIVFCFLIIIFCLIYALHFAPPTNFLNQELRPLLLSSATARRLLNLNRLGDSRYLYQQTKTPLNVVIWSDSQISPHPLMETWLASMILETVDRETRILFKPINPNPRQKLTDQDLSEILNNTKPSPSDLNIYLVGESISAPTNAGLVISPESIFIFKQTLNNLTDREDLRLKLEQSTLMHEWGHLLGLEHLDQDGCIMSEKVEVYENRLFQGSNIPTRYCGEELYEFNAL